jgi:hypothetical protein
MGSQDNLVSIEARVWLKESGAWIPVGARDYLFARNIPTTCSVASQGLSPGADWPGPNVKHTTLSNAEVKNEGSYASAPSLCHCGMNKKPSHICDGVIVKNIPSTVTFILIFSQLKNVYVWSLIKIF